MNPRWTRRMLQAVLCRLGPPHQSRHLRRWWLKTTTGLVSESGLFDAEFYLRSNADVHDDGIEPLKHYLLFGDREGRYPNPLFDPAHYRASFPRRLPKRCNALLHYLLVGRYARPELSPLFDVEHFFHHRRDAKLNGHEPLRHHQQNPSRSHYSPFASSKNPAATDLPHEPGNGEWQHLAATVPIGPCQEPEVDVVIPVYGGRAETLRCLHRVLSARQKTPFELVVINDSSPDETLVAKLRELATSGLFTLLENATNLGFTRTANRGLLLHPDRDVVLLNADTEPHNDWLDRLRGASQSRPQVASVTPLSNNATICSYPRFDRDNPLPLELTPAELDLLAATTNRNRALASPTGVGFCLYLRREALQEVGIFDELSFPHGYGEENDFCQRAAALGYLNLITCDTFVWHWGSRSFKGTKGRRVQKALRTLEHRHPHYRQEISRFIQADPLREPREALDRARLVRQCSPRGNVLCVMHNRGGGAERLMAEELQQLESRHISGFLLLPGADHRHGQLVGFGLPRLPNLKPVDLTCPEQLLELLEMLRITEIHVHQLVDFPRIITGEGRGAARSIATAARRHGAPLDFYVHDYQFICPRINLIGPERVYCGEPDEETCRKCLNRKIPGIENPRETRIKAWRLRHAALLAGARRVIVPDEDVKLRLSTYYPHAHYVVRPHEPPTEFPPTRRRIPRKSSPWRIVVPGAISVIKGFEVVLQLAKTISRANLPLELVVMGYSRDDDKLRDWGVNVTGRYQESVADELLRSLEPHIAWIPSVWPEAYCYAMSIPLRAGLPVACFDLGAPASRLRAHGGDHLLIPLEFATKPRRLAALLQRFASTPAQSPGSVQDFNNGSFSKAPPRMSTALPPSQSLSNVA